MADTYKKYDVPSDEATIVIKVGPIQSYGRTKAEAERYQRDLKKMLDRVVRDWVHVGPYSKAVKTTLVK